MDKKFFLVLFGLLLLVASGCNKDSNSLPAGDELATAQVRATDEVARAEATATAEMVATRVVAAGRVEELSAELATQQAFLGDGGGPEGALSGMELAATAQSARPADTPTPTATPQLADNPAPEADADATAALPSREAYWGNDRPFPYSDEGRGEAGLEPFAFSGWSGGVRDDRFNVECDEYGFCFQPDLAPDTPGDPSTKAAHSVSVMFWGPDQTYPDPKHTYPEVVQGTFYSGLFLSSKVSYDLDCEGPLSLGEFAGSFANGSFMLVTGPNAACARVDNVGGAAGGFSFRWQGFLYAVDWVEGGKRGAVTYRTPESSQPTGLFNGSLIGVYPVQLSDNGARVLLYDAPDKRIGWVSVTLLDIPQQALLELPTYSGMIQ
ncbi:MAG: hypothetical protein PVJ09_02300 [Candidatus Woesebacteria bacterium]|jgi:hypothetical protein